MGVLLDGVCEEGRDFVAFWAYSTWQGKNWVAPEVYIVVVLQSFQDLPVCTPSQILCHCAPCLICLSEVFGLYPEPVEIELEEQGEGFAGSLEKDRVRRTPEEFWRIIAGGLSDAGIELTELDSELSDEEV